MMSSELPCEPPSQSGSSALSLRESLYQIGRRISMISIASTPGRIFAFTLLASFLPGVKANCWVDSYVYLSRIHPQRVLSTSN